MAASFHSYICMFQWLTLLGLFIYGLTSEGKEKASWLWYVSLLGILLVPIFNEIFLCIKGCLLKNSVQRPTKKYLDDLSQCIPIVYSPDYNIHAFGLEKCHPFDSSKYRRIYADLLESNTINPNFQKIHAPPVPTR